MKIGILGAGQLGMMLAQAGKPLGMEFRFLDPSPFAPARQLGEFVQAPYDDQEALLAFAAGLDVITYEFENVPAVSAEVLLRHAPVLPHPRALSVAQDRFVEKSFFAKHGIPVPGFAKVDSLDDLQFALQDLGFPAVLKTRREGYDGKGQAVIRHPDDAEAASKLLGGANLILEAFVPFDREVSIIAVRGRNGDIRCYPLIENVHRAGILRVSRAPAATDTALQGQAEMIARSVLEALDYIGVLTIELFQAGDRLIANEMAPRVHNSGHLTIEATETSQFENHLRAVCGMELGSMAMPKPSAMVNVISDVPDLSMLDKRDGVHVHLYGKEPRPGRKLGHVTIIGESTEGVDEVIREVEAMIGEA